jgi:SpoVK/Ycf46/Vps4 family AAA+-type ATPase
LFTNNVAITILGLNAIREIEPTRPLVTVTEDLDEYFKPDKSSKPILSMYDGENQVDHVVHLATTNYPERLEDRIIQRPSRFDVIICLGTPKAEAREAYMRHMLGEDFSKNEFQSFVSDTKGLSFAHLKEFILATICLGKPAQATLARLQANMKKKPTLEGKGGVLGFQGEGYKLQYYDNDSSSEKAE